MILGLGIDLIEIDRIKNSIEKYGDRFVEKIFTEAEIAYCKEKANSFQHYAARFAAKEAVAKALGTGITTLHSWKNIEVYNDVSGKPKVRILGNHLTSELPGQIKISITHTHTYAACVAILESK